MATVFEDKNIPVVVYGAESSTWYEDHKGTDVFAAGSEGTGESNFLRHIPLHQEQK